LIILLLNKERLAISNDIISAQGLRPTLHNLLAVSRYHFVLEQLWSAFFSFGAWSAMLPMPLILFFYFLLLGASVEDLRLDTAIVSLLVLALMLAGYFLIYIITPHDLAWHVESSLSRLLLQLWPLFVLAYFMIVRSPEMVRSAGGDAIGNGNVEQTVG
jgi:hypothetical protein